MYFSTDFSQNYTKLNQMSDDNFFVLVTSVDWGTKEANQSMHSVTEDEGKTQEQISTGPDSEVRISFSH